MSHEHDLQRRRCLLGLFAALAPLPGAGQAARACATERVISDLAAPLTIDTHTHFFNGSDLQIREFLSQTTVGPESELYSLVKTMAGVLQKLAWATAPGVEQERAAMAAYRAQLQQCPGRAAPWEPASGAAQQGYMLGRAALQSAAAGPPQAGAPAILSAADGQRDALYAVIDSLPPTLEQFEGNSRPAILETRPTLAGFVRFLFHHFNFRYVNALDYFQTYSSVSARKIDMAVASLVDFDYWLAQGRTAPTPLADQVELMSELSVLLGGRVHGFVAFCPFRETMTLDSAGVGDALRLVRHAIERRGLIGVKLYPPMGFAAWGNSGKNVWKGKPTLDRVAWQSGFGARLDRAMDSLFRYCQDNDVPIMAHTNESNGPYKEFRALAGSQYWKQAFDRHPGLRVSFGHFGDSDIEDVQGKRNRPFLDLMTAGAGSSGANAFADSGFFAGTMIDQGRMRDTLLALYRSHNGVMRERLMYGSDWHMILTQQNVRHYLADFIELMKRVEEEQDTAGITRPGLPDAFFGRNAAEFLGLRRQRGNRIRLERFYAQNKVPQPDWMTKVDAA